MTQSRPDIDPNRLSQLSEEVSRIASSLSQMSRRLADSETSSTSSHNEAEVPVSQDAVRWLIKARRERARYVDSELFCDPAWDILLDLLQAELAMQRVSTSSLCIASGVPPTTALRYIKTMAERGMVVRRPDSHDGRRVFIELAPEISKGLRRYFVDVIQSPNRQEIHRNAA